MKTVKVHAPASIANIVCGFDILGLALNDPFDEMEISLNNDGIIRIEHTDDYGLSCTPEQNVAGVALIAMLQECKTGTGFNLKIHKNIKPGSGLGSSAASSAGAVAAANYLLN